MNGEKKINHALMIQVKWPYDDSIVSRYDSAVILFHLARRSCQLRRAGCVTLTSGAKAQWNPIALARCPQSLSSETPGRKPPTFSKIARGTNIFAVTENLSCETYLSLLKA